MGYEGRATKLNLMSRGKQKTGKVDYRDRICDYLIFHSEPGEFFFVSLKSDPRDRDAFEITFEVDYKGSVKEFIEPDLRTDELGFGELKDADLQISHGAPETRSWAITEADRIIDMLERDHNRPTGRIK